MAIKQPTRKPAPIVQCPHCNWKGSARGLFTHVRLGHPNKGYAKPPVSKQVSVHPYACDGNKPSFVSGDKLSVEEQKLYNKLYQEVLNRVSQVDYKNDKDNPLLNVTESGVRNAILETIKKIRNSKGYPRGMNG